LTLGRICTVCDHPDRSHIEERLVGGESYASIADRTGLGRMALARHKRDHSPLWLAKMTRPVDASTSTGTVQQRLEALIERIEKVLADAESGRRHTVVLAAARELRAALETVARISGELDQRPTTVVNLATSAEWIELQTVILTALAPYPDARTAVAGALAPLGAL
jgi:DNA-binding PucR family transcriptional regulator